MQSNTDLNLETKTKEAVTVVEELKESSEVLINIK